MKRQLRKLKLTAAVCTASLIISETASLSAYAEGYAVYPYQGEENIINSSEVADSTNFSRSSAEWAELRDDQLNWDEIAALVHEYNAAVVTNRAELARDERRSMDAQEVSDYLQSKADEMDSDADAVEDTSAVLSATYRTQANSLRRQAESNLDDFETIRLGYEQIEKQTALSAKTQFLNYYSALANKEYSDANTAYLEKAYNSAVNRKNVEMATELEVLTAKEAWDNARADLITADNNITSNKRSLIVLCGWKYDADAVIGELPAVTAEDIVKIESYESDRQKAEEANYTLRIDKIRLANAEKSGYSTLADEQRTQLKSDTDSFGINFKAAYDELNNSATAYNNAVSAKANSDSDLEYANKQFELGMLSRIELDAAVNSNKAAWLSVETAYNNMLLARAKYDAAVNDGIL